MVPPAAIYFYQLFAQLAMEEKQFTVSVVPCFLKATEWFWGAVLIWLLNIGCVESNPGPRTNEVTAKPSWAALCTNTNSVPYRAVLFV
jgi:hypothetical protein